MSSPQTGGASPKPMQGGQSVASTVVQVSLPTSVASSLNVTVTTTGNGTGNGEKFSLRCGSSWLNAPCGQPCPSSLDRECPNGQRCYANVSSTASCPSATFNSLVISSQTTSAPLQQLPPRLPLTQVTYETIPTASDSFQSTQSIDANVNVNVNTNNSASNAFSPPQQSSPPSQSNFSLSNASGLIGSVAVVGGLVAVGSIIFFIAAIRRRRIEKLADAEIAAMAILQSSNTPTTADSNNTYYLPPSPEPQGAMSKRASNESNSSDLPVKNPAMLSYISHGSRELEFSARASYMSQASTVKPNKRSSRQPRRSSRNAVASMQMQEKRSTGSYIQTALSQSVTADMVMDKSDTDSDLNSLYEMARSGSLSRDPKSMGSSKRPSKISLKVGDWIDTKTNLPMSRTSQLSNSFRSQKDDDDDRASMESNEYIQRKWRSVIYDSTTAPQIYTNKH